MRLIVFGGYTSRKPPECAQLTHAPQPMTRDEFYSKYRLLKQIAGEGGRSYTAQHRPSGRAVQVHFLDRDAFADEVSLGDLLEQLSPRYRAKVLEMMTVDGSQVAVTEFLEGSATFEEWLRSGTAATNPMTQPSEPRSPSSKLGEFTQLFQSSEGPSAPTPATGLPPAGPVERPTPGPAAGSFTELFRPQTGDPQAGEPPPAQGPPGATMPPVRVVGLRVTTPREPPRREPEPKPPPLRPNFGAGPAFPPPPPEPLTPRLEPRPPGAPIINAPEPPPPPPLPSPVWSGPSEFTRQLQGGPRFGAEDPPVLAGPGPAEPPAPPKPSYVPLLLALNLVFIIAVGLIVYFALKR